LKELNLDGADLEIFPKEISSLTTLESFSQRYCDCELPDVFDTLSKLPRLKKLYFTHYADNDGGTLPESFLHLQSLEEIHSGHWSDLKNLRSP
jgi:hypothetical protein